MSKVKKITVSNLKAVSNMTADFNGCTAIITGGNNKGKTSFLRSLFDRVRGVKPDMVLRQGETEGFAEAELTSGEKLRWEFKEKEGFKEKLTYISDKDVKSSLTSALRDRFFPAIFDVDKFLLDQPAKQRKTLQALVGLDFTDIDARYKSAYDDREAKNRLAHELRIKLGTMPDRFEPVVLTDLQTKKENERTRLNELYLANKATNDEARRLWSMACDDLREEVAEWNEAIVADRKSYTRCCEAAAILHEEGIELPDLAALLTAKEDSIKEPKVYQELPKPTYIPEMPDDTVLKAIDAEILDAVLNNEKAKLYTDWVAAKEAYESSAKSAADADTTVKAVEKERMDLIKSAKLPEGFGFSDDGITYNGLPFTREQLSSSGIYIAALKLAAMTLGDVRTIHFDASFLDKQSLTEIEQWAVSEDCQLLIERPDFEGGEIEYQLIA